MTSRLLLAREMWKFEVMQIDVLILLALAQGFALSTLIAMCVLGLLAQFLRGAGAFNLTFTWLEFKGASKPCGVLAAQTTIFETIRREIDRFRILARELLKVAHGNQHVTLLDRAIFFPLLVS